MKKKSVSRTIWLVEKIRVEICTYNTWVIVTTCGPIFATAYKKIKNIKNSFIEIIILVSLERKRTHQTDYESTRFSPASFKVEGTVHFTLSEVMKTDQCLSGKNILGSNRELEHKSETLRRFSRYNTENG